MQAEAIAQRQRLLVRMGELIDVSIEKTIDNVKSSADPRFAFDVLMGAHSAWLKGQGEPDARVQLSLSPDQALDRLNALMASALPEPALDVEYTTEPVEYVEPGLEPLPDDE